MQPRSPSPPSPRRARASTAIAVAAVLLLVVAACSDDDDADEAAPPAPEVAVADRFAEAMAAPVEDRVVEMLPIPEDFVQPDTRGVRLAPPPRRPGGSDDEPPAVAVRGGSASIEVQLIGPDGGAVPGAVVLVERFVGQRSGALRFTARGGAGRVDGLLGGRYRVRAWSAPDLTALESQTFFLPADGTERLRVGLTRRDEVMLRGSLRVATWTVGDTAPLEVQVMREAVSPDDGIVRGQPLVAEVALTPGPGTAVEGSALVTAGGDGTARWTVRCTAPGRHAVTVRGEGREVEILLAECVAPAPEVDDEPEDDGPSLVPTPGRPTTTSTTSSTTSTTTPTTTSTTVPR